MSRPRGARCWVACLVAVSTGLAGCGGSIDSTVVPAPNVPKGPVGPIKPNAPTSNPATKAEPI